MNVTVSSCIRFLLSTIKLYTDSVTADAVTKVSFNTIFFAIFFAQRIPSKVGNNWVVVASDGYL